MLFEKLVGEKNDWFIKCDILDVDGCDRVETLQDLLKVDEPILYREVKKEKPSIFTLINRTHNCCIWKTIAENSKWSIPEGNNCNQSCRSYNAFVGEQVKNILRVLLSKPSADDGSENDYMTLYKNLKQTVEIYFKPLNYNIYYMIGIYAGAEQYDILNKCLEKNVAIATKMYFEDLEPDVKAATEKYYSRKYFNKKVRREAVKELAYKRFNGVEEWAEKNIWAYHK